MANIIEGKRWSGFDWADQQQTIMLIGAGGIGSWTCLALSRIMHEIFLIDGDIVDETNVQGGQLYRTKDVGRHKVNAVTEICREFGCINLIMAISERYSEGLGMTNICITGLDNMAARKQIFEEWERHVEATKDVKDDQFLFIDGRMAGELSEIFIVDGNKQEQIDEYKNWLFDDLEIEDIDCTMKQTTFVAMGIASLITTSLCNWLANNKMGMELKEVPFHQRFYGPMLELKTESVEQIKQNEYATNLS